MNHLTNIVNHLSTEESIKCSAFAAGFIWSIPQVKEFLTNPLFFFGGVIGGIASAAGANFLANYMPQQLRCIFTILLLSPTCYYVYSSLKIKDKKFIY